MAKRKLQWTDLISPDDLAALMLKRKAKLQKDKDSIDVEIDIIDEELKRMGKGGGGNGNSRKKGKRGRPAGGSEGKRIRRSRAELEAQAAKVIAFIKSHKDGVKGSAIKKEFGSLMPSIKVWLGQYAKDAKLKTTGKKVNTLYFVG